MAGGGLIWLWQGALAVDTSDILDVYKKRKPLHGLVRSIKPVEKVEEVKKIAEKVSESDEDILILMMMQI